MALSEELRENVGPLWERMVTHPFVLELGEGTLPEEKFRVYFQQDYLFMKDWVTLLSLGIARSPDYDSARKLCAFLSAGLSGEEGLFRQAFGEMGLSPEQVKGLDRLPTAQSYGGFLRSIAYEGRFEEIVTTLLAIEWPYLEWAQRLATAGKRPQNPYYQAWIDIHTSTEMRDFVGWLRATADGFPQRERERLQEVFLTSFRYEYLFWEMAYRGEAWPS